MGYTNPCHVEFYSPKKQANMVDYPHYQCKTTQHHSLSRLYRYARLGFEGRGYASNRQKIPFYTLYLLLDHPTPLVIVVIYYLVCRVNFEGRGYASNYKTENSILHIVSVVSVGN